MDLTAKEIKSGLLVLISIVILVVFVFLIMKIGIGKQSTYFLTFDNVQGVEPGAVVRIGGIRCGKVKTVKMTYDTPEPSVIVEITVSREFPVPANSNASIKSIGIMGEYYVEIIPGDSKEYLAAESYLEVKKIPNMDSVMEQAGEITAKINSILDHTNHLISSVATLENIDDIAGIIKNVKATTDDLKQTGKNLNELIAENKKKISAVVTNAHAATDEVLKLARNTNSLVEKNTPGVNGIITNAEGFTSESLKFAKGANLLLEENRTGIKNTIENVDRLAVESVKFFQHSNSLIEKNRPAIDSIFKNTEGFTAEALKLTTSLNEVMDKNKAGIDNIILKLNTTSENMEVFSEKIKEKPSRLLFGR